MSRDFRPFYLVKNIYLVRIWTGKKFRFRYDICEKPESACRWLMTWCPRSRWLYTVHSQHSHWQWGHVSVQLLTTRTSCSRRLSWHSVSYITFKKLNETIDKRNQKFNLKSVLKLRVRVVVDSVDHASIVIDYADTQSTTVFAQGTAKNSHFVHFPGWQFLSGSIVLRIW